MTTMNNIEPLHLRLLLYDLLSHHPINFFSISCLRLDRMDFTERRLRSRTNNGTLRFAVGLTQATLPRLGLLQASRMTRGFHRDRPK